MDLANGYDGVKDEQHSDDSDEKIRTMLFDTKDMSNFGLQSLANSSPSAFNDF